MSLWTAYQLKAQKQLQPPPKDSEPQKLAGVICLSGYLPCANLWQLEKENESVPCFMAHGELDSVVPARSVTCNVDH